MTTLPLDVSQDSARRLGGPRRLSAKSASSARAASPWGRNNPEETGLGVHRRSSGRGVWAAPRGHAHQPLGAAGPVLIFWLSVPNWGELFPLGDTPCWPRCLLSEDWPNVPPPGPTCQLSRLSRDGSLPGCRTPARVAFPGARGHCALPPPPPVGRSRKETHTQSSSVGVSFGISRMLWWLVWTVPRGCHS